MRELWQTSKYKMGEESIQIGEVTHAKGGLLEMRKWMAPNKCCRIIFVNWSGQVH